MVFCSYEGKKVSLQQSVSKMGSDCDIKQRFIFYILYENTKKNVQTNAEQARKDISSYIFIPWNATMLKHGKVFNTTLVYIE